MKAYCKTCESEQEVELADDAEDQVYCLSCGEEFTLSSLKGVEFSGSKYAHYRIGRISRVEPVSKSKDLKISYIDVVGDGNEETLLRVVTNAKYCEVGWKVVVAGVGAIVPAGANPGEDDVAITVTKRVVQGVESQGMICDCEMLGWVGGAKGFIQQLPDSFNIGDPIPPSRPRS